MVKKRILFVCGDPKYPNNQIILYLLRKKYQVETVFPNTKRFVGKHFDLARKFCRIPVRDYDVVFVAFYTIFIIFLVRLKTRKPVIYYPLVSNYDTLTSDLYKFNRLPFSLSVIARLLFNPRGLLGWFPKWIDKLSCQVADAVIIDTLAHRDYFIENFQVAPDKITYFYPDSNLELFHPSNNPSDICERKQCLVFYDSSYLPLHGVEYIIEAARLLKKDARIRFLLVGEGPLRRAIQKRAKEELSLDNVEFKDWVPYEQMPHLIKEAYLCLGGHFSTIPKAQRVIAGKTFNYLAMGKPVIVSNSPANHEILKDGYNCLMCPPGDPVALVVAVTRLVDNRSMAGKIGLRGRITIENLRLKQEECLYSAVDLVTGRSSV